MRYFDRAGLFLEACQEYGFLSPTDEKNSILLCLNSLLNIIIVEKRLTGVGDVLEVSNRSGSLILSVKSARIYLLFLRKR